MSVNNAKYVGEPSKQAAGRRTANELSTNDAPLKNERGTGSGVFISRKLAIRNEPTVHRASLTTWTAREGDLRRKNVAFFRVGPRGVLV